MRALRIAMIGPSLRGGGLERVMLDLSLALAHRGHTVAVFTVAGLGVFARDYQRAGIQIHDCQERGFRLRGYPRRLIRALGEFRADLLHAHSGTWLPTALARVLLRGPRLVFTDHGRYPPEPWGRSLIERWCHRVTERLVCVSGALAEYDRQYLRLADLPLVIPNGIDLAPYQSPRDGVRERLRALWGAGPDDVLALAVGRLEPVKRHDRMIEALGRIGREAPALRLVFAGAGTLESALRSLAATCGVEDRVAFLGFRDDIPDCLRAADLWLSASDTEGLPISLLEGLASGLPVLATDVGGVKETLGSPPAGQVVPPSDVEAMAAALLTLATNPDLRRELATRAASRARHYSLDLAVDRYESVYQSAARLWSEPGVHRPGGSTHIPA